MAARTSDESARAIRKGRALLAGAGACAVLGAALLALLLAPGTDQAAPAARAAAAIATPPQQAASTDAARTGAPAPTAAPLPPAQPPAPSGAAGASAAYPKDPAALLRALRPLQREIEDGLASLDSAGRCPLRGALLQLTLESGDGEVYVRQVAVKRAPPAQDEPPADHDPAVGVAEDSTDEALLRCVRESMDGRTMRAPSARPGRRWQTFYKQAASPP